MICADAVVLPVLARREPAVRVHKAIVQEENDQTGLILCGQAIVEGKGLRAHSADRRQGRQTPSAKSS